MSFSRAEPSSRGVPVPRANSRPLRLAGLAASPLPATETHERHDGRSRNQGREPRWSECAAADGGQRARSGRLLVHSTPMEDIVRILIIGILIATVASLGSALFHLSRGGDSPKLVRALTVRVVLSIALFLLLMLAWRFGLITPHGLEPH